MPVKLQPKSSFDMEDLTVKLNEKTVNLKINDTNSQKTHGHGSNSTGTKEDDDFDLSFDGDFFFDLPRDEEDVIV
jgi:hypothetical protein